MQALAYKSIWLGILLGLVWCVGTVQAQMAGQTEQPATPSGQAGSMSEQGRMEMRGGQDGMGQMTCV